MKRAVAALALLLAAALPTLAADTLRVVSAGPVGEVRTLAEANEIRVTFSEPMVVLGKIPTAVTAPWFRIAPAVSGTFRWSGTTTLIFTPDAKKPLPYATHFTVTIDATATSVAGNRLDKPYRFELTTPTILLQRVEWYRKGGDVKNGVVIALWFNQPVTAQTILPHLQVRTRPMTLRAPEMPAAGAERLKALEPQALPAFQAKVEEAKKRAASDGEKVLSFVASDWDKERFPPAPELVILETKPGLLPGTGLQSAIDETVAQGGSVASGRAQSFSIELEPMFFVAQIDCVSPCDPARRNGIGFLSGTDVRYDALRQALTVTDITDPAKETKLKPKAPSRDFEFPSSDYSLDELGYELQPMRRYAVRIDPSLRSANGQTLGYTWMAVVEEWHKSAFVSFGDGFGVWESSGGPLLPFHARNYRSVRQWLAPMTVEQVMPTMLRMKKEGFSIAPEAAPQTRTLNVVPDKIQSHGLNLQPAIGADNVGLAWAAVEPGEVLPKSFAAEGESRRATLVQSTNLGISVKDSPQNTLIMVTRLDDAKPVAAASVSIRDTDNKVVWRGTTDANGVAIAANTDLRRSKKPATPDQGEGEGEGGDGEEEGYDWTAIGELHFLVVAEKDGDVAYVGSDWNEDITPWMFDATFTTVEADPVLRGTVFTDRGVYKPGEEVHLKAVLRSDTPAAGMQLLPTGTKAEVAVRDSQGAEVDKRTIALNAWSSGEWTFKLPAATPLGDYSVVAKVGGQKLRIGGSFLVAAYRRPDFRVDATLTGNSSLAGQKLRGTVAGRYLFGGAMAHAAVAWTYAKQALYDVPAKITDRWPAERFTFLGDAREYDDSRTTIQHEEGKQLDAKGELKLTLETDAKAGWPFRYQLEGVVTDVTRQQIAGRASFRVDPAPWYIGIANPPYFVDGGKGIDTQIVAAGLDGLAAPGVAVKVELKRVQWTSARSSEGEGFYSWDSERKEIASGQWTVTTEAQPVPLHVDVPGGGEFVLYASASDKEGRTTTTRVTFYAIGSGYTAWERYDHNRIDLVPEKKTYRPGETARILIKSPWETATALLTTEREGVRTWKPFPLGSTQQTISVPITEKDIPNIYVSVLLVKGRTKKDPGRDGSDPGKPAFRLGYVELTVEDASKRLAVDVKANRDEFRPASKASIDVTVRDAAGKPSPSEVTLWAVDYGVLSLTGYQTPDVLDDIYLRKGLQVINEDSRQRIVSRRVLTPKGSTDGGGGGRDAGPGTLRKDFRVLAFWLGSMTTDAKGHLRADVTLPESLTTYRIMAVAGDRQSRFGWAQNEIRINKPLMLTPAFPRFLAVGDKATFGGVVHSASKTAGTATVTMRSLDAGVLELRGGSATVPVAPGPSAEVRFDAVAKAAGDARVQMRVQLGGESDGFEDVIPVRVLVSPETVAAYGEAKGEARETLEIPSDVIPGFGGLHSELSSSALVGLGEGARYLVTYPYGCAEQRGSAALSLLLGAELGDAFALPGIDARNARGTAQATLDELKAFQCGDGGFAYWKGECDFTSPYLTSWLLHVFEEARTQKYRVDAAMIDKALGYLETSLARNRPENEAYIPSYLAWQAFAVKVLAEGGRNVDSDVNRLYGMLDRMPAFGIAHLADAMLAKGEKGARLDNLRRHLTNAILPEGGYAHVEELRDPYLLWFWSSNTRTTAIVLGTLVRNGSDEETAKKLVRWLMKVRKEGRWGNTQENAWAMESLIDYYRKYEAEVPDFTAVMSIAGQPAVRETFKGRTTTARTSDVPMQQVMAKGAPGAQVPVVFTRQGAGTLFYLMRLRYARTAMNLQPLESGFHVERSYAVSGGSAPATTFKAGDLIQVTLRIRNTKERRFVAITDPIPAGTEPVESWFATTAAALAEAQRREDEKSEDDWMWWERSGFDHVERHDDRVDLFATRLTEGWHEYHYLLRATTSGTFVTAPAHAEEMYEPEVFGRSGSVVVEVGK